MENILDAEYISDHVPIVAGVAIPPKLCDRGGGRKRIQHVVKADITQAEVQRVLRNSSWPDRPFYRVAKSVGLAEIRETFISEF